MAKLDWEKSNKETLVLKNGADVFIAPDQEVIKVDRKNMTSSEKTIFRRIMVFRKKQRNNRIVIEATNGDVKSVKNPKSQKNSKKKLIRKKQQLENEIKNQEAKIKKM